MQAGFKRSALLFVFDLNVLLTVGPGLTTWLALLRSGINLPAWQAFTIKDQANGVFGWVALGLI